MPRWKASVRLLRCALHIGRGVAICALIFPFRSAPQRMGHVQRWCQRMLVVLGIAVRSSGESHAGAALFVANHVSWLDILAIMSVRPMRFVSKSDVRRWPVLGWLVACGGTLFIERGKRSDALRVVHLIAGALQAGDAIALFPEGTTSDGHGLLPFHANLLQAAISAEVPVQPIALRFADAASPVSAAAAYVGEMTLVQSLWAVATAADLTAHVALLPAQPAAGQERRALASQLSDPIAAQLARMPRADATAG